MTVTVEVPEPVAQILSMRDLVRKANDPVFRTEWLLDPHAAGGRKIAALLVAHCNTQEDFDAVYKWLQGHDSLPLEIPPTLRQHINTCMDCWAECVRGIIDAAADVALTRKHGPHILDMFVRKEEKLSA